MARKGFPYGPHPKLNETSQCMSTSPQRGCQTQVAERDLWRIIIQVPVSAVFWAQKLGPENGRPACDHYYWVFGRGEHGDISHGLGFRGHVKQPPLPGIGD